MKMIKYFVFDTNALISAYIREASVPARALSKAVSIGRLVRSNATLIEFTSRFLRTKFDKYFSQEDRLKSIDEYMQISLPVTVIPTIRLCRDPDDDKFLELAIAANAACIITGDSDLLALHPFYDIPILNAADFLLKF